MICAHVRSIIPSLKLGDYLSVQAHKPCSISHLSLQGLNYNYLYSIHAWLLVHPWWLCNDWAMGCVPVIESFSDGRIICAVAVWIVIGALLVICLKTPVAKDNR